MKTAALLALMLVVPANAERQYWREGPITIERQLNAQRPQPVAQIVYIDALGFATRDGVLVTELDRGELLGLVVDLLDYEMALSWPPDGAPAKRRKRGRD